MRWQTPSGGTDGGAGRWGRVPAARRWRPAQGSGAASGGGAKKKKEKIVKAAVSNYVYKAPAAGMLNTCVSVVHVILLV